MFNRILIIFTIVSLLGLPQIFLVQAAPPARQGPGTEGTEGIESLFTSVTISPNASLPDGSPGFTCFDLDVAIDPGARVLDLKVGIGISHTWVGDLIFQLHSPDGEHLTLLHRPGRSSSGLGDSSNLNPSYPLTFSSAFFDDAETMGNTLSTDQVICQDDGRCNYFPNRDEDLESLQSFAQLAGTGLAGTWQFCASDVVSGDAGILASVTLDAVYTLPDVGACMMQGWVPTSPVNTGRSRPGLAYSEATGRFYLLGGEASGSDRDLFIEAYDPHSGAWNNRSKLPTGVSNTGAVAVGAYIYVPGGFDGGNIVALMQRYDPAADTTTLMANMPAGNSAHAAAALDGKIYVLGGASDGNAGTTNYIYNVAADTWSSGAPLPTAVQYPAAAADGEYIYVLGGNTSNIPTVQRYDPAADTWETLPDMITGRGGPAAFFDGANIWVVGGGWSSYLKTTEYWDGSAWQPGPLLNSGARTTSAAYGDGIALKAAGWSGVYMTAAEVFQIDCSQPEIAVDTSPVQVSLSAGSRSSRTRVVENVGSRALSWWTPWEAPTTLLDNQDPAVEAGYIQDLPAPGDALTSYLEYGLALPEPGQHLPQVSPAFPSGEGFTFYADRAAFNANHPGLPLEDFEAGNVAAVGVKGCPGPFDSFTQNSCFSPGDLIPGFMLLDEPGNNVDGLVLLGEGFNSAPSKSVGSNTYTESLNLYFRAPGVNAVGMNLQSHFSAGLVTITLYAWDGATVIGTATAAATPQGIFWGVFSEQPVGRIKIFSPTSQAEAIDDLVFGYLGECSSPDDVPWVKVSPASGTAVPGGSESLEIEFSSTGLTVGSTHSGTLCISSGDPYQPLVQIPLSVTIEPARVYLPLTVKR